MALGAAGGLGSYLALRRGDGHGRPGAVEAERLQPLGGPSSSVPPLDGSSPTGSLPATTSAVAAGGGAAGPGAVDSAPPQGLSAVGSSTGRCGIERWSVKTGTDQDAALVELGSEVPSTIGALDTMVPPASPPADRRVRPVETTVYAVRATLTRFKLERDSDYHLVLEDGSGHTMIAELADPACVGGSSPLAPGVRRARSQFAARYSPERFFRSVRVPVLITGVGFFDFVHGQSGVAPNGIELHPVLSITFDSSGP